MGFIKKCYHWTIAYKALGEKEFHIIPNPEWGWCADPFLVEYKSEIYLFAEIFLYKSERKGVIAYCKYAEDGFGDWQVTMDEHWHLSYPNVFARGDDLFMCPESYQNKTVSLYKLKEFPDNWERVEILIDNKKFVDTTFLTYNDDSYMFTFAPKFKNAEGSLLLYKKQDGTYRHVAELSSDKTLARPGGNFFERDGKLIRVGQNSEHTYGEGLVFLEVDSIFPSYKEHEVKRVYPNDISIANAKKYCGMHTYNCCSGIEVIDLKYSVVSMKEAFARRRVRKVFVDKY